MRKKVQIGILVGALFMLFGVIVWVRQVKEHKHDLPHILHSGRLSVVTDKSSMGFTVEGDSVSGFQYEIVKAFADTLGLELVMNEEDDLAACVAGLNSGEYDLIANLIPVTSEWKKTVLFTNSIETSRPVLVQRATEGSIQKKLISTQLELADDTIYIPLHSPYKMRLQHLSDEIADTIQILEMENLSTEQMVRLVSVGKLKYTICDEKFAHKLKLIYPTIDVSLPLGFEQQQAWAVDSKSVLLLEKLNLFLKDFIGSSAFWEIYRKYN